MAGRALFIGSLCLFLSSLLFSGALAAEKLKLGTSVKLNPNFYLPILAGEEKGFWKEEGLEVEWVPFSSVATELRAVAAGALSLGMGGPVALVPAMARGIPVVIVSNHSPVSEFLILVRADSLLKEPRDLKGTRVGILTLGAATHAYGRVVAKVVGVEKEVRFVATGGPVETIAALRVKAVDSIVLSIWWLIDLILKGEARELAALADYLPKDWIDTVVFARKELVKDKPDVVRRVVKAILRGNNFALSNRSWSLEKMKAMSGYSEEAAKLIFERLRPSRTGKIERTAIENIRNFLIEYELVPREKAPPLDEIYTTKFID